VINFELYIFLLLPMNQMPITAKVVRLIPACSEMFAIQLLCEKVCLICDRSVIFSGCLWFPPLIKLMITMLLEYQWEWC